MAGVDLATVKEIMGRKPLTLTFHNTHLAPGHMHSAIAVLDRFGEKVPSKFTTAAKVPGDHMLQVGEK